MPPGYPFFLGGVYRVTGDSRPAARATQVVLGALAAVLAAELGRRLISVRTGAVAGVVTALLPSHALYSAVLMSEVLFTTLLLAGFVMAARTRSPATAAAAGVAFGLATLVRAQAALLIVAVFASWWAYGYFSASGRRRSLALAVAVVGGLGASLAPWTVRNAVQLHAFVPVSTNLGLNLWVGNNPDATGSFNVSGAEPFAQAVVDLPRPQSEVTYDRLARDAALRYATHHPMTVITRAPEKILETYRNDRSWASWYEPFGARYIDPDRRTAVGHLQDDYYYGLLLGAAAGMLLLGMARAPALALPLAALVVWSLVSVVFFGDTRYHIPILPVLAVPAAYALTRAYDAGRAGLSAVAMREAHP